MGFFKELIRDNKDLYFQVGLKKYLSTLTKILWYLIINPLILSFFVFKGWWVLVVFAFFFTTYGLLILFQGRNVMELITEYQTKKYLKSLEPKKKDEDSFFNRVKNFFFTR